MKTSLSNRQYDQTPGYLSNLRIIYCYMLEYVVIWSGIINENGRVGAGGHL